MAFNPEQTLLAYVLMIKRMVALKKYDACLEFVIKAQDALQNLSNAELRDKIKDNVLDMTKLIDKRSNEEVMADLGAAATVIIAIFKEYGIV